jgi:hypothetical protein
VTEPRYLDAIEFTVAGQPGRVHAAASYDGQLWLTTVCGLAIQAYVSTGTPWRDVAPDQRCARCVAALAVPAR